MKKRIFIALFATLLITACNRQPSELTSFEPPTVTPTPAEVGELGQQMASLQITFDFERQSGWASNQFAVWLETEDGDFVRTLYVTGWTANGGYASRPMSIPLWVQRSGLAGTPKHEVDTVSGATPRTGLVSVGFAASEENGFPPGEYRFFVEGSLRWSNRVMFSGLIEVGDQAATVEAERTLIHQKCDNHDELTDESAEISMLSNVIARYTPST
jgi:hypothetical protein